MFAKGSFCHRGRRPGWRTQGARFPAAAMSRRAEGPVAPRGSARRLERQGRFTQRFPQSPATLSRRTSRLTRGARDPRHEARCTEPALIRVSGFVEVACAAPRDEQIKEGRSKGKTLPFDLDCRGFPGPGPQRLAARSFARCAKGGQWPAPTLHLRQRPARVFALRAKGRTAVRPYRSTSERPLSRVRAARKGGQWPAPTGSAWGPSRFVILSERNESKDLRLSGDGREREPLQEGAEPRHCPYW